MKFPPDTGWLRCGGEVWSQQGACHSFAHPALPAGQAPPTGRSGAELDNMLNQLIRDVEHGTAGPSKAPRTKRGA